MMFIKKKVLLNAVVALTLVTVAGCSSQSGNKHAADTALEEEISDELTLEEKAQQLTERQRLLALPNKYKSQQVTVDPNLLKAVDEALSLKKAEKLDQAKAHFTQLSVQYPTMSALPLYLGDIALEENDKALAVSYYQQAINVNPANYYAHNRLAKVLREQGKFDLAKTHYEAALVSWPAFAPAHLNLGILFDLYIGDKAQARSHYQIYQILTDNSDQKVRGWIKDITMQLRRSKKS